MKMNWATAAALLVIFGFLTACGGKKAQQENIPETESRVENTEQETQILQETEGSQETSGQDLIQGSAGELIYEVTYEDKTYQAEDGAVIFEAKLAYPVFMGNAENIVSINTFFDNWKQEKIADYEQDDDSTRRQALEVYRESRDSGWMGPWSEEYRVSRVDMRNAYISVLLDSYLYEGGNHGMPYRESFWFRENDGKRVDLLSESGMSEEQLESLMVTKFRERIKNGEEAEFYEDAEKLLEDVDWEEVGSYLGDTGIVFYLQPYEIGPYSSGYAEVEIPFEEIFVRNEP